MSQVVLTLHLQPLIIMTPFGMEKDAIVVTVTVHRLANCYFVVYNDNISHLSDVKIVTPCFNRQAFSAGP